MAPGRPNLYYAAAWKNPVAQGVSDTWYVELRGYAKVTSGGVPFCVPNEYVASRIGLVLGIPVPPGGPIKSQDPDQGAAWVTLDFSPKGELLPPADPRAVAAALPNVAASVIVFDMFIGNTDRHCGNLAFTPSTKRLDVFDHSHALLGVQPGRVVERFEALRSRTGLTGEPIDGAGANRHCLLDEVSDAHALLGAAEEVEKVVGDRFLRRVCSEAADLDAGASPEEMMQAEAFLRERRGRLKALLFEHQDEFPAIRAEDWGMEL